MALNLDARQQIAAPAITGDSKIYPLSGGGGNNLLFDIRTLCVSNSVSSNIRGLLLQCAPGAAANAVIRSTTAGPVTTDITLTPGDSLFLAIGDDDGNLPSLALTLQSGDLSVLTYY
mgnify:FL=1